MSNDYKTNQKMIFMSKFTPEQITELNDKLKTPEEVLGWGLENIHPKLALASSFGAEDVCVIHMLSKSNPEARVFSLDTGRINQETYDVMDEIRKKYKTKIEIDEQHDSMVKLNPILDWSWEQTMGYIKENDIPYNKLIDDGFPSIGCEPCTRAIKPGEDLRAGRWWWENQSDKECGLHMDHKK